MVAVHCFVWPLALIVTVVRQAGRQAKIHLWRSLISSCFLVFDILNAQRLFCKSMCGVSTMVFNGSILDGASYFRGEPY